MNSISKGKKATARRKKNMQQKEIGCEKEVDRISQLPNEILISIVCRLTLREATATSVLSSRWRNLYTYFPRLCYLPSLDEQNYCLRDTKLKTFRNYINILNHKLDSYKGGKNLKEFRLRMPCLVGANIERWFEFALAREVEIIKVDMVYIVDAVRGSYTLPISTLITRNGRFSVPGLKTLKTLSLSGISMEDIDVGFLLSNFHVLESLSVAHCGERFNNVSIVGDHYSIPLKLKQLDISHCSDIRFVEVRDVTSLVSLTCYEVPDLNVLRLINVPKLVELSTCGQPRYPITGVLHITQRRIIDQLLHLKLSTNLDSNYHLRFKLTNMRHLELEVKMRYVAHRYALHKLVPLLKASPLLEKLDMKFSWDPYHTKLKQEIISNSYFWMEEDPPHHCILKQATLSGYFGSQSELQFAKYIMKNAVALEKLIVEPCHLNGQIQREATARERRHFPPITPSSVNLVIL